MTRRLTLCALFAAALAACGGSGASRASGEPREAPLTLLTERFELAHPAAGFEPADLAGRPVLCDTLLLDRWSLWGLYPEIAELRRRHAPGGLQVVTLIADDPGRDECLRRAQRFAIGHPILMTSDAEALADLQELGSLVLFDTRGNLIWSIESAGGIETLDRAIRRSLPPR